MDKMKYSAIIIYLKRLWGKQIYINTVNTLHFNCPSFVTNKHWIASIKRANYLLKMSKNQDNSFQYEPEKISKQS